MTVGGKSTSSGARPRDAARPWALACTVTEGVEGSSDGIVNVDVCGEELVGVKVTAKGKQKSGLIATGYPPDGVPTANKGLDDVMGLTFRFVLPVLPNDEKLLAERKKGNQRQPI